MSHSIEPKSQLSQVRYKLLINLAINGLLPYLAYILLRPHLASEVAALAIAASIPAMRALVLWLWRRRIDWLGVYFVFGFAIVLAISVFLSGNAILLEIHGSLLSGTIGLVLLVSAILRKPLLLPFFLALGQNGSTGTGLFDQASSRTISQARITRRISFTTAVTGLALFVNMLVHVALALTLPVAAYLGVSHLSTWAILGSGLALLWLTRQRNNAFSTGSK